MMQVVEKEAQHLMDLRANGALYHRYEPNKTAEDNARITGTLEVLALFGNSDNLLQLLSKEEEEDSDDQ